MLLELFKLPGTTYYYKPNEEGVSRAALAGWNRLQKELN